MLYTIHALCTIATLTASVILPVTSVTRCKASWLVYKGNGNDCSYTVILVKKTNLLTKMKYTRILVVLLIFSPTLFIFAPYLRRPVPFSCHEPKTWTEVVEKSLFVVDTILLCWSALFIGLFVVIYIIWLCFSAVLGAVFSSLAKGTKKLLQVILKGAAIIFLPPPITLFAFKSGVIIYDLCILVWALMLYSLSCLTIYAVENWRTEFKYVCSPVRKVIVTVLHGMEVYATFAVFAGLFDSCEELSLSLIVSYIVLAAILGLTTWLKNILDSLHLYAIVIKKGKGVRCGSSPCVADVLLATILCLADLVLIVLLMYYDSAISFTKILALMLAILSLVGNVMVYAGMFIRQFMEYSICKHCKDRMHKCKTLV